MEGKKRPPLEGVFGLILIKIKRSPLKVVFEIRFLKKKMPPVEFVFGFESFFENKCLL